LQIANREEAMPQQQARKVEVGSRLKECRTDARLSLGDVAEEMGVTKQAVSAWEHGRTKLDALQLGDLALMYGVSSDYLLFGTRMVPQDLRELFSRASR
jgi:transcriptional regulator with XRE-family HTH domain